MPGEKRELAAIMFTDVAGYTALSHRDERLALELLEEHARLLRGHFQRHGGREIKALGDGFLVEFPSALQAAECAVAIQRSLAERNAGSPPSAISISGSGSTWEMSYERAGTCWGTR